jgi:hypothetical protein
MDELLIQQCKINVQVRRHLVERGIDPDTSKYYCYVLLLDGGKVYVGQTNNIYQRLLTHFTQSRSSAKWVKVNGPVKRILEICVDCSDDDERLLTLKWMALMGVESVRGSAWCNVEMQNPPAQLSTFDAAACNHMTYLSRAEIDHIHQEVAGLVVEYKGVGAEDTIHTKKLDPSSWF